MIIQLYQGYQAALSGSDIQDRAGRTASIFYLVVQVSIVFPADGKNTGNADALSCGQSTEQFQMVRAGVVTQNNQPAVLQPDMDFDIRVFFPGLLASMKGIFKQVPQKGD